MMTSLDLLCQGGISQLKSEPDALQRLPTYFGSLYEAWEGNLLDRHYLFLVSKGDERSTPAEIAGHHRVAVRELGRPVVFVFMGMESFESQRLVQHRVPFVVPRRLMYLPEFLIDLREGTVSLGHFRSATDGEAAVPPVKTPLPV
jgi:hypothetical protein